MNKLKKHLSLVLLFALVLSAAVSCTDSPPKDNKNKESPVLQDGSNPLSGQEETPSRFIPDLPDMDFGGYEFRSLVFYYSDASNVTFDSEEENGETINDAIYGRNRYVEDKYNVVLKQIVTANDPWNMNNDFKRSVGSGSDDFDICLQVDFKAFELVAEGYVLSADKLPYINLSQPWYAHDINEALSVKNKNFIAFGDECLTLYEEISILCFNKKLVQDLGIENPYSLAKSGKWTYDRFFDMCRLISQDLDSDGKMTEADRYGIVSQSDQLLPLFWVCAGCQTVTKDNQDMLTLNLAGNEKLFNLLDKARQNIYGGEKIYYDSFEELGYVEENRKVSRRQFENDLALFYAAGIGSVPHLRTMETDFGIIPFPKADESQNRYYSRVANPWPKIVPVHAQNPERTSIILEAVAAESRNTVIPALKETCLKTKFARDDESVEMLNLIFDTVFMDLGDSVYWDIRTELSRETMGKGNFASFAEKNAKKFQNLLDKFNDAAEKME